MEQALWTIRGRIAFIRVPDALADPDLWEWSVEQFQPDSLGGGGWVRLYRGETATLSQAIAAGQAAVDDVHTRTDLARDQVLAAAPAIRDNFDTDQRWITFNGS